MALITRYLKTSNPGADPDVYTSLAAWEAAEQADLVAAGDSHELVCDAWVYVGDVTISGWTTGPGNKITIKAAPGHEHNGVQGAGVKFTVDNYSQEATVVCDVPYLNFLDVEIKQTLYRAGVLTVAGNLFFDRCIIEGQSSSGGNDGAAFSLNTYPGILIQNCWLIQTRTGQSGTGVVRYYRGAGTPVPVFKNCTFVGERGIYGAGSSAFEMPLVENCVFATSLEAVNGAGGTTWPAGTRNNAVWGAQSSFGVDAVTGIGASDFVDEPNDDYSIDATSALYDAGADLSAEFTTDIQGNTITTWSIGAFQVAGGAPATGPDLLLGAAGV